MDALIRKYDCGIVVKETSPAALEEVAERLLELFEDPDLADRCRACVMDHFDLDVSVRRLASVYQAIG